MLEKEEWPQISRLEVTVCLSVEYRKWASPECGLLLERLLNFPRATECREEGERL